MLLIVISVRVDDMKLESFEGLEIIPREILQQGPKKIAGSLLVVVIIDRLKRTTTTSIR